MSKRPIEKKLLIAIPSKGRPEQLRTHTLMWLAYSKYRDCATVFIEPQDAEAYLPVKDQWKVEAIPENDQGLGYAKVQVAEFSRRRDFDFVFKVDDDLNGWNARGGKSAPEESARLFDQAIEASIALMERRTELVGVSFPYRWELYEVADWTYLNARFQTAYLVRSEHLYPDPAFSAFEDFHTYLMIRKNNLLTVRYGLCGIDCEPVGDNDGGHQSDVLNRASAVLREAKLLREIHPALEFRRREGKAWAIEPRLAGAFFGQKKLV